MVWGVKNYLSELRDGEDDTSMTAHRVRLCSQSKLSLEKRDQPLIRKLMDLNIFSQALNY